MAGRFGSPSGAQTQGKLLSIDPASWPRCLWTSYSQGKRKVGCTFKQSGVIMLSSPWSWPRSWSRYQAKGCQRAKQSWLEKAVIFGPPKGTPSLLSNFSALGFMQEKILATSFTKISISLYESTLKSSPEWQVYRICWVQPREKQLSKLFCSLLLPTDASVGHSLVSQWYMLFQEAQGDWTSFPGSGDLLSLSTSFHDWI